MIEIIPAIMPESFRDLEEKMSLVDGLTSVVQVDLMDGILTGKKSWPYFKEFGLDRDLVEVEHEIKGFPFWEDIDFEADLMLMDPQKTWKKWLEFGAKRLVFHIESEVDMGDFISQVKESVPQKESFLYPEIGLAINTDTPNEKIYPLISQVDFVQFMGISKIGYQGQPFDRRVVPKIKEFRERFPDFVISIDGGVSLKTAPDLIEAGANRLIVGSGIYKGDVEGNILDFKNLADEYEM